MGYCITFSIVDFIVSVSNLICCLSACFCYFEDMFHGVLHYFQYSRFLVSVSELICCLSACFCPDHARALGLIYLGKRSLF